MRPEKPGAAEGCLSASDESQGWKVLSCCCQEAPGAKEAGASPSQGVMVGRRGGGGAPVWGGRAMVATELVTTGVSWGEAGELRGDLAGDGDCSLSEDSLLI